MEKKETNADGTKEVKKVTVINYNPITKQVYNSSEIASKKDKKAKKIVIFVLIALMVAILLASGGGSGDYSALNSFLGSIIFVVTIAIVGVGSLILIMKKSGCPKKVIIFVTLPFMFLVGSWPFFMINDFIKDVKQGTIIIELYDCTTWADKSTTNYIGARRAMEEIGKCELLFDWNRLFWNKMEIRNKQRGI